MKEPNIKAERPIKAEIELDKDRAYLLRDNPRPFTKIHYTY